MPTPETNKPSQAELLALLGKPEMPAHLPLGDSTDFRTELCSLINKHSMENGSNTPDFILNQFLADVLMCFNKALRRRDEWYNGPVTQPANFPCRECGKPGLGIPNAICPICGGE